MRFTCQLAPLLLGVLALTQGCYRLHEIEGGPCAPPPGEVCCNADGEPAWAPFACPFACLSGSRLRPERECRPTPIGPDAGGPIDAWRAEDAGPMGCPSARASTTCLESFLVEPGRPFELPIAFDSCGCCDIVECRAEVTAVDGAPTLRLETSLCVGPCDCDTCVRPSGHCSVPALSAGAWNVVVNGASAFTLPVFEDSGLVAPPPACVTYAEEDRCRPSEAPLDPWGWRPSEVCVGSPVATPPQFELTLANDCWSCGDLHGPCIAALEPRFTDDLPPGGEIHVAPSAHSTWCDVDCPDICLRAERRCLLPPLVPGHFYRVWADGEPMLSFTAGERVVACAGGAGP